MLAPIILFVYKRLEHTRKTLAAINSNYLARESELFIFSDASDTEENQQAVDEVREYIQEFSQNCSFKQVYIINAEEHKGLANSVISGVTQVINRFGKVIVLEDDIITTRDFLNFMNDSLDYYEENENVWSITGCTFPMKLLDKYPHDVYLNYRADSWSWATWKDRWDKTDWDVTDFEEFVKDKTRIKKFNRGGEDMTRMLKLQMEGEIDSWAIRWCYQQSKEGMYTICPRESFILNIGLDGSGEHCKENPYGIVLKKEEKDYKLDYPDLSLNLMKEYKRFYHTSLVKKVKIRLLGR